MQNTANYGIMYGDTSDPTQLSSNLALLAQSVDDALVEVVGETPVANVGDLPASGSRVGQPIWVTSAKMNYVWNGTMWVPERVQGRVTMPAGTSVSASIYYTAAVPVSFPAGRFSQAPHLLVTSTENTSNGVMWASARNLTNTGFQVLVLRLGSAVPAGSVVDWLAYER